MHEVVVRVDAVQRLGQRSGVENVAFLAEHVGDRRTLLGELDWPTDVWGSGCITLDM